jgi:hypothetical protein
MPDSRSDHAQDVFEGHRVAVAVCMVEPAKRVACATREDRSTASYAPLFWYPNRDTPTPTTTLPMSWYPFRDTPTLPVSLFCSFA